MSVSIAEEQLPFYGKSIEKKPSRRISWAEFERRYLGQKSDEFDYEWVDGLVEKTKRTMEPYQFQVMRNLRNFFKILENSGKATGYLECEFNLFFAENINRKPDVFYFTEAQADEIALGGKPIPKFLIEVISNTDQLNNSVGKMDNYRDAGVEVVWHIFPKYKQVHVYDGDNLTTMTVCKGDKMCSAAPVLSAFELSASAIFQMPTAK